MKILNLTITPNDKIITRTNQQLNPSPNRLLICRREAVAHAPYYTAATAINNEETSVSSLI